MLERGRQLVEQLLDQVAVDTGRGGPAQAAEERQGSLGPGAFGEPLVGLDLEPARSGKRLHSLDAAKVRAREDPVDVAPLQLPHEDLCLAAAAGVQRAEAVVTGPLRALACRGMADQVDDQASASSRERSTFRSRLQLSVRSASSSGSQRVSSPSRWEPKRPSTG